MKKLALTVRSPLNLMRLLFMGAVLCSAAYVQSAPPQIQPACVEFELRLPTLKQQLPAIIVAAERSAYHMLAHPEARLRVPYYEQLGFSEEMRGRAGGFSDVSPSGNWEYSATPYDVVLLSVRSWEIQSDLMRRRVAEFKANGWLVTVIGSAQGKPTDLGEDFFLDNGAPDASAKHGRINVLANVAVGWMWCCEYASAMSRKGWFPAILYSVGMENMAQFNASVKRPERRSSLLPCAVPIAPGDLAMLYYTRLKKMVSDVKSPRIQNQITDATEIIAQRMAEGRTVAIAGMGHVILAEVKCDNRAPWLGFRAVNQLEIAFRTHLRRDDLLVWMTYCGMNSRWDDYAKPIADTQADLITCYAPDLVWGSNAPPTLAHIDQSWELPDADIPIPVLPHVMAPISGLNGTLLMRMLDDAVADRLVELGGSLQQPTPDQLDPEFLNYSGVRQRFFLAGARPELWAGTWQIIDTNGTLVCDKTFEEIRRLSHGRMAAREQGRWGFVDEDGNWVIKPVYTAVSDFKNGQARVRTEQGTEIIDKAGEPIFPSSYNQLVDIVGRRRSGGALSDYLFAETNGLWGIVDATTGTNILPLAYTSLLHYADKRLMFQAPDLRWGLIDATGEVIAPATFDAIFPLTEFAAKMVVNGKFGGIDREGNIVVEPTFDFIESISKNVIYASKDGYFGNMTHAGVPLVSTEVPTRFKSTLPFGEKRQLALEEAGWGVINEEGETIVPFIYSDLFSCNDDRLEAKQAGRWGVIDGTNGVVIPLRYEKLWHLDSGSVLARCGREWERIDLTTGGVTPLTDYDFYEPWSNDSFKVMKDGKWGVIARSGEVIIPLDYSFIYGLWNNWLVVAKGGQWEQDLECTPRLIGRQVGLIDWQNRVVIPCQYEAINPYSFGNGRLAVATTIEDMTMQP